MILIPKSYFIISGIGEDNTSEINAFDNALINAGIANYNWVPVSSILPNNIYFDKEKKLPKEGAILFCVMARMDGKKGEIIQTGIGVAECKKNNLDSFGLIIECTLCECKNFSLDETINLKLKRMCKMRGLKIVRTNFNISPKFKIKKNYGTALSVVVFNDYYIYNY